MAELIEFTSLMAFLTLLALEIVLGVDNVVFIAVVTGRLPENQRAKARNLGLIFAALGRIMLLFAITWVMQLEGYKLLTLFGMEFSAKDLILLLGGLFLLGALTVRANATGAMTGAVVGATVMSCLWLFTSINGYLYTACGIGTCVSVGYLASLAFPRPDQDLTGLTIHQID